MRSEVLIVYFLKHQNKLDCPHCPSLVIIQFIEENTLKLDPNGDENVLCCTLNKQYKDMEKISAKKSVELSCASHLSPLLLANNTNYFIISFLFVWMCVVFKAIVNIHTDAASSI